MPPFLVSAHRFVRLSTNLSSLHMLCRYSKLNCKLNSSRFVVTKLQWCTAPKHTVLQLVLSFRHFPTTLHYTTLFYKLLNQNDRRVGTGVVVGSIDSSGNASTEGEGSDATSGDASTTSFTFSKVEGVGVDDVVDTGVEVGAALGVSDGIGDAVADGKRRNVCNSAVLGDPIFCMRSEPEFVNPPTNAEACRCCVVDGSTLAVRPLSMNSIKIPTLIATAKGAARTSAARR